MGFILSFGISFASLYAIYLSITTKKDGRESKYSKYAKNPKTSSKNDTNNHINTVTTNTESCPSADFCPSADLCPSADSCPICCLIYRRCLYITAFLSCVCHCFHCCVLLFKSLYLPLILLLLLLLMTFSNVVVVVVLPYWIFLSSRWRFPRPPTTFQISVFLFSVERLLFFSSASLRSLSSWIFSSLHCNFVRSWVMTIPVQFAISFKRLAFFKISTFLARLDSLSTIVRHFAGSILPTQKKW